jgi:hypothetical protein
MRLLIYTAAIAVVLFAYGVRIERMQGEVRSNHAYVVEHQAELGARIEELEWKATELFCVHYIYEDGSAVHVDAEASIECLNHRLGWPRP